MKLLYLFLFFGFLFFGCNSGPKKTSLPATKKVLASEKPAKPDAIKQAREFKLQANLLPEPLTQDSSTSAANQHAIFSPSLLKRRKIILELPEDRQEKMPIVLTNELYPVIQKVKPERRFSIVFENDIFDMTDRYYTNGIRFEWSGPGLVYSPFSYLMLDYGHPSTNTYSTYLAQNMYTPISTKIPPELSGNDRPYAAYLILGYKKEIIDTKRKLKLTNDIAFGVIGSYSLGSMLQQGAHHTLPTNDPPLGWETQINNDAIAGYRLQVEKSISEGRSWQLSALAAAEAGTLYDNLLAGFQFDAGMNNMYANNFKSESSNHAKQKVKLNIYFRGESRLIVYDATLQGGMFNHKNIYSLHSDQMKHMVLKADAGVLVRYWQYGLELGQTLLTPEYSGGKIHKWGRIALNFYFSNPCSHQ
jgi:lipid A 3-O-deacylase